MSLSDEHVELKILAIYRKVINQNLLMNCDPNLLMYRREFNHGLVKILTKLACSNLKKSQTTMFTLLLHRSITLCRIEFSNISVKYSNVNFQCQLKFIYSEKATKFCEIFPLLLTMYCSQK